MKKALFLSIVFILAGCASLKTEAIKLVATSIQIIKKANLPKNDRHHNSPENCLTKEWRPLGASTLTIFTSGIAFMAVDNPGFVMQHISGDKICASHYTRVNSDQFRLEWQQVAHIDGSSWSWLREKDGSYKVMPNVGLGYRHFVTNVNLVRGVASADVIVYMLDANDTVVDTRSFSFTLKSRIGMQFSEQRVEVEL